MDHSRVIASIDGAIIIIYHNIKSVYLVAAASSFVFVPQLTKSILRFTFQFLKNIYFVSGEYCIYDHPA